MLQLASRIWASWDAGVRFDVDPNGDIIDDMARFNFEGVLLNDSARPTWKFQYYIRNLVKITSYVISPPTRVIGDKSMNGFITYYSNYEIWYWKMKNHHIS